MKYSIIAILLLFVSTVSFGQKKQTVEIQSSIVCEMCVDRLDDMFADMWAVKGVDYNLDEQTILIKYNSRKISVDEIKNSIAAIGYDADDILANEEAHDNLPKCCQKGATPHPPKAS